MPLASLPRRNLPSLVRAHLVTERDDSVLQLTRRLGPARARGHLTLLDLEAVCYWKSPRAIWHVRSNSPAAIRRSTGRALWARNERARMESLIELRGVSIPMASALLTLLYPRRYGVIDIRVWQLLHELGAVSGTPAGVGLSITDWLQFLEVLRRLSKALGITARQAERTLFEIHRRHQSGRLYDRG